jgi:organic radical activating enzyme
MTEREIEELEGQGNVPVLRNWILLSEAFLSHQGEGPSAGQRAFFVRLGACNLTCHWCDTPYTWAFTNRQADKHRSLKIYDPKLELKRVKIPELAETCANADAGLIVITGGEPMLQEGELFEFIDKLNKYPNLRDFEIETAGTIPAYRLRRLDNVSFNVSLKLATSGNDLSKRRVDEAIIFFRDMAKLEPNRSRFKFVITDIKRDLAEIEELISYFGIPRESIWLMPEGTTQLSQVTGAQLLMPIALEYGFHFTSRLHVLGYGDKRGI